MIQRLFKKSVNTQRLTYDPATKTEIWTLYLTEVMCYIQTWAAGEVGYEGAKFPTHSMWCDFNRDVIPGDRIIDGATVYEVLSKEELNYGKNPHLQLTLSLLE